MSLLSSIVKLDLVVSLLVQGNAVLKANSHADFFCLCFNTKQSPS